ncbi:MAG TPA: tRNA uridine-5-carboxymethylaminomethyl(34) synthesis GTPase MnmE [Armatimonadota bacterium]
MPPHTSDTIAALATPPGQSALGVIRLSGPSSLSLLKAIFRGRGTAPTDQWPERRACLGWIRDPATGHPLDQVVLVPYPSPRSYTGEDMAEITCHGSPVSLREVLALLLRSGARLAGPGEFTQRAFLNGKLDLAQAEAVMDAIGAESAAGLSVAIGQLEGRLSSRLAPLRTSLLEVQARLEAAIDFPDEIEEPSRGDLCGTISQVMGEAERLLKTAESGRLYREGALVVICGRPNVGKSTLMNALLREARAIVTSIPGTTRDILEEPLTLGGVPLRLVDTAGLREADNPVEREGVERARAALEAADIAVVVLDRSEPITEADRHVYIAAMGREALLVANKCDLPPAWDVSSLLALLAGPEPEPPKPMVVEAALGAGWGLEAVERALEGMLEAKALPPGGVLVSNLRHKAALEACAAHLAAALRTLDDGYPLDLLTVDLSAAARQLGSITGDTVTEDVIMAIFSRFCVGK